MHRWDIINYFIEKYSYKTYLEIGYYKGWSFDNVKCEDKTAVDPNPSKYEGWLSCGYGARLFLDKVGEHVMKLTSDDFFGEYEGGFYAKDKTWDIIFIDGLHEASQVTRDIENSLKHLSPGGTIVLHDCNPPTLQHTTTGDCGGNWNGDVYKAFIEFRGPNPQYEAYVIDTDWGCGVIKERKRMEIAGENLTYFVDINEIITTEEAKYFAKDWETFDQNRKKALNLISVEEFLKKTNEGTTNTDLSA